MKHLRRYVGGYLLLALLGANAFIYYAVFAAGEREFTVAFLDVGQGDAIFIESPTGVQVLIDGGPDDTVLRELSEVLAAGDRSLNAVVATHPDQDHIGGLVGVLERFEVGAFIESGVQKNTSTAAALARGGGGGGTNRRGAGGRTAPG